MYHNLYDPSDLFTNLFKFPFRILFVGGMKEKIAFSIDSSLLKKVDSTVDGVRVKSRSHALEMLIRKALGEDEVRGALILAGAAPYACACSCAGSDFYEALAGSNAVFLGFWDGRQ